jgi:ABC-type polysaccharide/polyol phosphate transport system ATPase subunit
MTVVPEAVSEKLNDTALPDVVIQVSHVHKEYRQHMHQLSLRHETGAALQRILGRYVRKAEQERFYAVRDVSFAIRKGEAVGVVGHNGAGKTTLLRLLSGITKPTSGSIEVKGNFATLIGVSAGFNFDMPGRRNIYLNAAFFGWHPDQIRDIEQQIVDFADIGEFIDAPVKVYSSGMIARLGFSIAIHLLPDIIFLDEVLSVGDAKFAAKCQERIYGLREENRTIVLVSHSPGAVQGLCTRAIWMNHGQLMMDDVPEEVLRAYASS